MKTDKQLQRSLLRHDEARPTVRLGRNQEELSLLFPGRVIGYHFAHLGGKLLSRIPDLKIGDKSLEGMHRLCSCVSRHTETYDSCIGFVLWRV